MRLNDKGTMLFKIYRDENASIEVDRKNTQNGYRVIDQDEDTGIYAYFDGGDETGWTFWNMLLGSTMPIEFADESRETEEYYFFKSEEEIPSDAERLQGFWGQTILSVMRKNGLSPITGKEYDPDVKVKEVDNSDDSFGSDIVHNIMGYNVPFGIPGILSSTINQDTEEQYFVPSGGYLSVDHKAGGMSTRVFDVKSDGYIDVDKIASLDSVFVVANDSNNVPNVAINCSKSKFDTTGYGALGWVEGSLFKFINFLSYEKGGPFHPGTVGDRHEVGEAEDGTIETVCHIYTEANFYQTKEHDGPLDFETTTTTGAGTPPNPDGIAKVHCKFNTAIKKWQWEVPYSTDEGTMLIARIAWDYTNGNDKSICEIMKKDETGVYRAQEVVHWIDYNRSRAVLFQTAGNKTLFRLKFMKEGVIRDGVTHNLYRATHCIKDEGFLISHCKFQATADYLTGYILSYERHDKVWQSDESKITTTILAADKPNIFKFKLPLQWDNTYTRNEYLEVASQPIGLMTLFRPIRPTPSEYEVDIYESLEKNNDVSIAQYRIKVI